MPPHESPDNQQNYPDDEPPAPAAAEPWHRKPVALVAFGAAGALLAVLIIYGLARAITGDSTFDTTTTTSLTPVPSTAVAPPSTVTKTVTSMPTTPATTTTTEPSTTTTTPTTTTTEPSTTTTTPTTTGPTTTVSTSTVTQTETQTVTEPPPAPPAP